MSDTKIKSDTDAEQPTSFPSSSEKKDSDNVPKESFKLYDFDDLVDRAYTELTVPTKKQAFKWKTIPQVKPFNKITIFLNFTTICDEIKRDHNEVFKYFVSELC